MFGGTHKPLACCLWSLAAALLFCALPGEAAAGRDRRVIDFAAACQSAGVRGVISGAQAEALIRQADRQFVRAEGDPPRGIAHVDKAHDLLGEIYFFMREVLGLDSIDNRGGALVAAVGARFQHGYDWPQCVGDEFNAAWVGSSFVLLSNDALPLVEVVAHEIAHGVIDHGSALVYEYESGALNEAISDALGVSFRAWRQAGGGVDNSPADFRAFDGVWRLRKPGGVIRDMRRPKSVHHRYPDHYDDYARLAAADDHGGVHINSSIINQAFYLLSEGGRHPRLGGGPAARGVGIKAAANIYTQAAVNFLTEDSDFKDARYAFARAAEYLYGGKHSAAWIATHQAMDAVGIPGDWPRTPTPVTAATPTPVATAPPPAPATPPPSPPPSSGGNPAATTPTAAGSLLWFYVIVAALLLFAVFCILRRMRPGYGAEADGGRVVYRDAHPAPRPAAPVASPQPTAEGEHADAFTTIGELIPAAGGAALPLVKHLLTEREGLVIGRAAALCHIVLNDKHVSRRHLRLRLKHGGLVAQDLNSTHGTRIGGKSIRPFTEQRLEKGRRVEIAGLAYVLR